MRVAERIHGNAAKKIEVLLAGGVVDVSAAPMSHDHRLTLVGGQKKLLRVEQTRVGFSGPRRRLSRFGEGTRHGFDLGSSGHHATESAACAVDKGSRRTRVPGIEAKASAAPASAACDASNNAPGEAPPTMRTSRTPPSIARLAASSFKTMPAETTRCRARGQGRERRAGTVRARAIR